MNLEPILSLNATMMVMLIAVVSVLIWSLIRRDRCRESAIDLEDLLIGDDGKLSKAAAVMMGSWLMTTWLMVYLALQGKMSEGYLTIYGGLWIAPTVVRLITNRPSAMNGKLEDQT